MRRDSRLKKGGNQSVNDKIIMYTGIGVAILAVIVFALFMYSKSLNDNVQDSTLSAEKIASIMNATEENSTATTQSASTRYR